MAKALRSEGFDCIFGAIDLSIRYAADSTIVLSCHPTTQPLRPPTKNKAANAERNALLVLEGSFPIFPSPSGCAKHGAKLTFNETLEQVSKGMGMGRPETKRLVDIDNPPCNLVLKREFSDTSMHVHIPNFAKPKETQAKQAREFLAKSTKDDPEAECLWLTQEHVPFLAESEVRFICVDGTPVRDVVTGRRSGASSSRVTGLWSYETNDSLKTLRDLQCVRPTCPR